MLTVDHFQGIDNKRWLEADFDGIANITGHRYADFRFAHFRSAAGNHQHVALEGEANALGFLIGEERSAANGGGEISGIEGDALVLVLRNDVFEGRECSFHEARYQVTNAFHLEHGLSVGLADGDRCVRLAEHLHENVQALRWNDERHIAFAGACAGGYCEALAISADQSNALAFAFHENTIDGEARVLNSGCKERASDEAAQCLGGGFEGAGGLWLARDGVILGVVTKDLERAALAADGDDVLVHFQSDGGIFAGADDLTELVCWDQGFAFGDHFHVRHGQCQGDLPVGGAQDQYTVLRRQLEAAENRRGGAGGHHGRGQGECFDNC